MPVSMLDCHSTLTKHLWVEMALLEFPYGPTQPGK